MSSVLTRRIRPGAAGSMIVLAPLYHSLRYFFFPLWRSAPTGTY